MFFILFLPRELDGPCEGFILFLLRHGVQALPLALPSAIHCFTATMPALTVTLSANEDGSALGASGMVGWVVGFVKTAVAFLSLWRQY